METVICPLSYTTRQPLETLCGSGYTVAAGKLNYYFASDLLHRLYHVATIGEGAAEHYADSYEECLALAKENPAEAVRNSHTLQYFALDVYAYDVALPGNGCTGKTVHSKSSSENGGLPSASSTVSPTTSGAVATSSATAATSVGAATTSDPGTRSGTTSAAAVRFPPFIPKTVYLTRTGMPHARRRSRALCMKCDGSEIRDGLASHDVSCLD